MGIQAIKGVEVGDGFELARIRGSQAHDEIVIDSEGSLLRFGFNAISREYTRPAFVHDDEVDENGNPLPQDAEQDQVPMDDAIETASEPAADVEDVDVIETADTESK